MKKKDGARRRKETPGDGALRVLKEENHSHFGGKVKGSIS